MGTFILYHPTLVSAGAWSVSGNDYKLFGPNASTIRFSAGTTAPVWALDGAPYSSALPFGLLPPGFAIVTAAISPNSVSALAGTPQWFMQWDAGTEGANDAVLTLPIPTTPSLLQTNGMGCRGVTGGGDTLLFSQPLPLGASGGNAQITGTYETICLITSISPVRGPVGTVITITGVGFDAGSTVTVAGVSATVTFVSSTTLMAVAPANGQVVVTKSDGSISKIPVTLGGRGFNCGISSVTVCGTKATDLVVLSDTQVTANVRSGTGICNVVVTDSAGQTAPLVGGFRFGLPPC